MKTVLIFLFFIVSSQAIAGLKQCNNTLGNFGIVTLTQEEPTDIRGLPAISLRQVFNSLKGKWIQVNTRRITHSMDGQPMDQSFLMRVLGTEVKREDNDEIIGKPSFRGSAQKTDDVVYDVGHFFGVKPRGSVGISGTEEVRHETLVLVGTVAGYYGVGSSAEETDETRLHKELPFGAINSVRLVDVPEIAVDLMNLYKPDGRPRLAFNTNLEQEISMMAEGDRDATLVLGILLAAQLPSYEGREVTFDDLLRTLVKENIRGKQIVAAYRNYARGSLRLNSNNELAVRRLVDGVYGHPEDVVNTVNQSMKVSGKHYRHVALNPWFLTSDSKMSK